MVKEKKFFVVTVAAIVLLVSYKLSFDPYRNMCLEPLIKPINEKIISIGLPISAVISLILFSYANNFFSEKKVKQANE
jgi:hypothetical protein